MAFNNAAADAEDEWHALGRPTLADLEDDDDPVSPWDEEESAGAAR